MQKCLEFGISLNPKKCIFGVPQGKLLGHIVSKEGVSIDLDWVKAIKELPLPVNKKGVQSFLGKVNFVSRFISDFTGIVRPITLMLNKDIHFKWTAEAKNSFDQIKHVICSALVLSNPDMSKDFIMYVYFGQHGIAMVLTQKDIQKGGEHPIAFHSKTLKDYELCYNFVEKQALAAIKGLKKFRHFIAYNKTTAYVAHPTVREYIMEGDITEKRANWITKILEYDVDIKPTKLVHRRGLCEYIVQDSEPRGLEATSEEKVMFMSDTPSESWIDKRKNFKRTGIFPENLPPAKRRFYRLQNNGFRLINEILFKRNFDGVLLRCVDRDQDDKILQEFHYGPLGGHFYAPTTAIKITQAGYHWPFMFKNVHALVRGCKECQYYTRRGIKAAMPLKLVSVEDPFAQWGLDFV